MPKHEIPNFVARASTGWLWEDNDVQFPRLLAEINAAGLTKKQMRDLSVSMDLPTKRIRELLNRAEEEWERLKAVR